MSFLLAFLEDVRGVPIEWPRDWLSSGPGVGCDERDENQPGLGVDATMYSPLS
jgi:hypothetical protein